MSLVVNGLPVASMRWLAGWSGLWSAELEMQSDVELVPSGRVTIISTEGDTLVGSVDEDRSGTFGERRSLGVLGGAGWRKDVRAQHYHSDVGLPLASLVSTTAAEVGEAAIVLLPSLLGTDFVRLAGPASQIFEGTGVDWWVGLDGVTRVGKRLPGVPPLSLLIKEWNPLIGTASFTCETLVEPGTVVVDVRFGTKVVREVEATFSGASVNGTLWLVDTAPDAGLISEFANGIGELARAAIRPEFCRFYEYRVIGMAGDRVELQAVKKADGVPDVLPASVWAGASGYRATLTPSSSVLVGFRAGDPTQPYVAFYEAPEGDGWRPIELELDATAVVTIAAQAAALVLGGAEGAEPIARAPAVISFATALENAITAAATASTGTGPAPVTGATLGTTLTSIATALAAAIAALTSDCPSTKVVSK